MQLRTPQVVLGTVLVAAVTAFAPAAHASRVGFNVSIGGPGYGIAFGDAPYWGYRPYYRPAYYPRPVIYAPPRVVYVAPRARVVYRAPYVRYPVVVGRPVYYGY